MSVLPAIAFVLVFAAVLGLVGWLVVRTARHNRAPRDPAVGRDLARLAAERGWHHTPRDDGFLRRFTGYPFGRGGSLRPALDLVTGAHRGRPFACFQFSPPRSLPPGERVAAVDYVRVVAVSLPAALPAVVLTPAGAAPSWTRRYTVGDDEFDRTFKVGTEDEPFAGRLLTEPVRRWLLANPPKGALRIGGGPDILVWQPDNGGFDPRTVEPTVDHLCDLLDRLPPDVLRQSA